MMDPVTAPSKVASLNGSPFPGLRPFNPEEQNIFFGRDGLSDTLLEKLRLNRLVAVVGTSGSGKSSLVRAGLLPALRGGFMTQAGSDWHIALFRPINNPIHNLAISLSKSGLFSDNSNQNGNAVAGIEKTLRHSSLGLIELVSQARMKQYDNLLIVADQFEELYRFEPSSEVEHPREEASAFVRLLLEATNQIDLPIYVILTMRSDYLGDSAHFWGLPEAINRGQFLIPRMDDDEKREAIEGPIRVFDARISAALVNRLLNDVGDDPRQLPILQHALMRTWDYWKINRSDSEPIGIEHYNNRKVGGMKEALSIHADEAYTELNPEQQVIAQKIFKRLTEKGVGKREGRLPATVSELAQIAEKSEREIIDVIEVFRKEGRSFLMPPAPKLLISKTLIDISHESLISGWTKLSGWVEEEAISAKIYQRLIDDALAYPHNKGLLIHPELGVTLKWRDENRPNEAWAKRYRTEFGKALDEYRERRRAGIPFEPPAAVPDWAEADDSEFTIAMRYLDRSQQKLFANKRSKTRKRRLAFAAVAGVAFLFLVGTVIASSFAANFRALKIESDDAKVRANQERDNAQKAQQNSQVAQVLAEMDREQKIVDSFRADDGLELAQRAANQAERLKVQAVLAARTAQSQAERGNLLESAMGSMFSGDTDAAVKAFADLERRYNDRTETRSKVAPTEIWIGNALLQKSRRDRNDKATREEALKHYQKALVMSQSGTVNLDPSQFIRIGDEISMLGRENQEAISAPYYIYALQHIDARTDSKSKTEVGLKLADAYRYAQKFEDAEKAYKDVKSLAENSGDPMAAGKALVGLGDISYEGYNFLEAKKEAVKFYWQADRVYDAGDSKSPTYELLFNDGIVLEKLAFVSLIQMRYPEAIDRYQSALKRFESARDLANDREKERISNYANYVNAQINYLKIRSQKPQLEETLLKIITDTGIDAAIKQYRDLKTSHNGQYDFSERTLNNLGYGLLGKNKVSEAIEIFKLNIEAYPNAWNTYDSLGDAYAQAGQKELALENYDKSLRLNPNNTRGAAKIKQLKAAK